MKTQIYILMPSVNGAMRQSASTSGRTYSVTTPRPCLAVEVYVGVVPGLGAGDCDPPSHLHPGVGEDGTNVSVG